MREEIMSRRCKSCGLEHPITLSCADAKDEYLRLVAARESARRVRKAAAMARLRKKAKR